MQQKMKSKPIVLGLKIIGLSALLVCACITLNATLPLLEAIFFELQRNGQATYFDFMVRVMTNSSIFFAILQVSLSVFLVIRLIDFK